MIVCVFSAQAQRTTTAADATTTRLGGSYTPTGVTLFSGTTGTANAVYQVVGNYTSADSRYAGAANVKANMHFIDGSFRMYRITEIVSASLGTTSNLTVKVAPISTTAGQMVQPATTAGFIFEPTPNMLLPQWVVNMSPSIQGALLSHLANMIDTQLSASAAPSVKILTASYTLTGQDDTILFNTTTTGLTVNLPSASTNSGKTFKLGKIDETSNTLTFNPSLRFSSDPNITMSSVNYPKTLIIQSNGTDWWIVNQQ